MKAILHPVKIIDSNTIKCELSEAQTFGLYLCNDDPQETIWIANFDDVKDANDLVSRLNLAFDELTEI
jgi:hypothetical protein